ncbi:MAG TPA: hypothetical protein VGG34_14145 [Opitutaceae bacterium]|jgi:uncharacterized membrane protein YciS (DUF1049 family)
MSFKAFAKLVVFLGTLFIVLYIGVNNRQSADFNFPLLLAKKATTDAWEIYFGMFAIGVFAGAVLMAGGGKGAKPEK